MQKLFFWSMSIFSAIYSEKLLHIVIFINEYMLLIPKRKWQMFLLLKNLLFGQKNIFDVCSHWNWITYGKEMVDVRLYLTDLRWLQILSNDSFMIQALRPISKQTVRTDLKWTNCVFLNTHLGFFERLRKFLTSEFDNECCVTFNVTNAYICSVNLDLFHNTLFPCVFWFADVSGASSCWNVNMQPIRDQSLP